MKILTILLLPVLFLSQVSAIFADQIPIEEDTKIVIDEEIAEEESIPIVTEDVKKKTVMSENNYFELELVRGAQSPFNKSIPYTVYITPKIESDKTQIRWEVPSTLKADPSHKEIVTLNKGETYKFKATISPQRAGTYDVTVNIVSWQYNTNYTNSVSSTVTLSDNLVVDPVDSEYTISILFLVLFGILLLGGAGFFVYKSSDKIIKRIKIWLTPPY